jgi:hypothetical protein
MAIPLACGAREPVHPWSMKRACRKNSHENSKIDVFMEFVDVKM